MPQKKKTPKEIQKLIEIYSNAKIKILTTIKQKEAKGNVTAYQKSLLHQVNIILNDLNREVSTWSRINIFKFYRKQLDNIINFFKGNNLPVPDTTFSKMHKRAIELLSHNMASDLIDANNFVGRKIKDTLREVSLNVSAEKFAVGLTVKKTKDRLIDEFLKNGITGFKDKAGRNWQIDTYAAMVANTTYAETVNRATLNQLTEWHYDLVKVSQNNSACPICAPLEGRIYSISGKDKRFPALDVAYSGDYLTIHPYCKHTIFPYIPELADNFKADLEYSNKPFNIDARAQERVDKYNEIQKGKQELRQDKRQFEKFKMVLGNKAPKTFSSFRNIKKNHPGKFDEYLEDYKLAR